MAKRITEILVDDIDGTEIATGEGRTVRFSLDGTHYEIDLTAAHVTELREVLAPYISVARKAAAPQRAATRTPARPAANLTAVRDWLRANGHEVSARGRIPAHLLAEYQSAHTS